MSRFMKFSEIMGNGENSQKLICNYVLREDNNTGGRFPTVIVFSTTFNIVEVVSLSVVTTNGNWFVPYAIACKNYTDANKTFKDVTENVLNASVENSLNTLMHFHGITASQITVYDDIMSYHDSFHEEQLTTEMKKSIKDNFYVLQSSINEMILTRLYDHVDGRR